MMLSGTHLQISEPWDAASIGSVPELETGVVHLWRRELHASAAEIAGYYELLSPEEKQRALRFRVERPRIDFILTRGTLRLLLAHYLGVTPREVGFRYGNHGKPVLEGNNSIRFNVSHTQGLGLLTFVRRRAIGVDVENISRDTEVVRLAERFFSERERHALQCISRDELQAAFFRCWTRKEAYIKAKGDGLALPLHQFDVSIVTGDRHALLATRPDPAEAARWTICDVPVGPGYAAAVAIADPSN